MPEATFVLFAKDELHVSTYDFGLLLGVTTVGAVVGGIFVGKFADRINTVVLLQVTYLTYGLLLIPIAFLCSPWITAGVFFVQGLPLIACDTAAPIVAAANRPGGTPGPGRSRQPARRRSHSDQSVCRWDARSLAGAARCLGDRRRWVPGSFCIEPVGHQSVVKALASGCSPEDLSNPELLTPSCPCVRAASSHQERLCAQGRI